MLLSQMGCLKLDLRVMPGRFSMTQNISYLSWKTLKCYKYKN